MTKRVSTTITLTIANGAALTEAFEFGGATMFCIHMPAAWTTADIGFQVSSEFGGTYLPLYDESGAVVEVSGPAASRAYAVTNSKVASARFIKLWSQSAGVGTNQAAERVLTVDIKT